MRGIITFLLCFGFIGLALGQTPNAEEQDTSSSEKIRVIYADLQRTVKVGNDFDRFLEGNVQIIKDSSFFYCDTARLNDNFLKAWGDVSMIKNDSLEVFADSMVYDLNTEEADIYGSVYIKNKGQVLFSDYFHFDDKVDIAYYTDKAILKDGTVELKSKRGEYRTQQDLAIFSQKVSVRDSSFELFADTLLYDTKLNKSIFKGPTNIFIDSSKIYCEDGYFLMDEEKGVFRQNAVYTGVSDTATANVIKVDGTKNEVELIEDAIYRSNTTYAEGDYIKYNEQTGDVTVRGNGYVKDGKQELRSDVIVYNKETKKFSSEGRTTVTDETSQLTADDIKSNDTKGVASGDVIFQDSTNGVRIDSEFLEFDQGDNSYNKAYNDVGKALLRSRMEGTDSLFISADTLFTFQQIVIDTLVSYDEDSVMTTEVSVDTTDFLTAYHGVKIYSESFQAACDSLAYNTSDSVLTMYVRPVMWSDTSQFRGDTIVMYFDSSTIDQVHLFPKSFIMNSADEIFYNQISGKRTETFFTGGKIDSMNVDGNAQSIYYLLDELQAYIAVNRTVCSSMTFHFEEQLDHIDFRTEPTSNMYPMTTDHDELKLVGYDWQGSRRPMSKIDLINLMTQVVTEKEPAKVSVSERIEESVKESVKGASKGSSKGKTKGSPPSKPKN